MTKIKKKQLIEIAAIFNERARERLEDLGEHVLEVMAVMHHQQTFRDQEYNEMLDPLGSFILEYEERRERFDKADRKRLDEIYALVLLSNTDEIVKNFLRAADADDDFAIDVNELQEWCPPVENPDAVAKAFEVRGYPNFAKLYKLTPAS